MKIVIVSDTHGSRKNIENVCECNPDADMLIHLGDVEDDEDYIEAIFGCPTHIVGGNNDFFSRLPREEEFELEGHHIEDIIIEEPSIEEVFMHYYLKEEK